MHVRMCDYMCVRAFMCVRAIMCKSVSVSECVCV